MNVLARLGVAWGMIYGPPASPPERFVPLVRDLGGGFTRVNLFWSQLEPERGRYEWELLDAYLDQLSSPDEGMVTLWSSSPWATRASTWFLPPSPARDLDDYRRFVRAVVRHARGRVRWFQNDSEPANPLFWSGSREEYVAQVRAFHRAVKDEDPSAIVVLGASDGLFGPPGEHPIPGQDASLGFVDYVLAHAGYAFDVFDIHLYGDAYTIPGRVELVRAKLAALGLDRPIIAGEYGGPGFFDLPVNRRHHALLGDFARPAPSPGVAALYARRDTLPPETQMFLAGCSEALERRLLLLQERDLVMRNVLAFSAGVGRTAFWDLWHDASERDAVTTLLFGKLKLMDYAGGRLTPRRLAAAFRRLAARLDGLESIHPVPVPGNARLYAFEATRRGRGPLVVVWERRDPFDDGPPAPYERDWPRATAAAVDAAGVAVPVSLAGGRLRVAVTATPVFVE